MAARTPFVVHVLFVMAVNAIPVIGVVWLGWSVGTALALLWIETILAGLANLLRIRLHRRLRRGRAAAPQAGAGRHELPRLDARGYGRDYARTVFLFSGAHGFFLAAILAMAFINEVGGDGEVWRVGFDELRRGAAWLALAIVAELGLDLIGLPERSFTWLERRVGSTLGRVAAMHLALIFGMLLASKLESPVGMLLVFLALKAGLELLGAGGGEMTERAPASFLWLARRMGRDGEAEWRDLLARQQARDAAWDRSCG
jgi:hypothetical protein